MRNSSNPNAKNNSNVAHNWAHGTGLITKGSNFFYEESGVIFSYGHHAPLALNVANHYYLIGVRTYSTTTATKHMPLVRRSIPDTCILIPCYAIPVSGSIADFDHDTNLSYWKGAMTSILGAFNNARNKTALITQWRDIETHINAYAAFFTLPDSLLSEYFSTLYAWFSTTDTVAIITAEEEKTAIRNAAKQAKEARLLTESASMWRNFEISSINRHQEYTLLRYNKKTNNVETSKGIKVPVEIAIRLYSAIMHKANNGGCKDCNLLVFGSYHVNTITPELVIAGCHRMTMEEITNCYNAIPNIAGTI